MDHRQSIKQCSITLMEPTHLRHGYVGVTDSSHRFPTISITTLVPRPGDWVKLNKAYLFKSLENGPTRIYHQLEIQISSSIFEFKNNVDPLSRFLEPLDTNQWVSSIIELRIVTGHICMCSHAIDQIFPRSKDRFRVVEIFNGISRESWPLHRAAERFRPDYQHVR